MQSLETLARDILAQPRPLYDTGAVSHDEWTFAAQLYLDNKADGHDEPDDLIELLARDEAWENRPHGAAFDDCGGIAYEDGPDFDDWFAGERPLFLASVRSCFGMVSA